MSLLEVQIPILIFNVMIIAEEFPVSKLPKELRDGFEPDERVTVVVKKSDGTLPEMSDEKFDREFLTPPQNPFFRLLPKASAILGALLACFSFIDHIRGAVRVNQGFPFFESLFPDLLTALIFFVLLVLPAVAIWTKPRLKRYLCLLSPLYPALLALGLLNAYTADDPVGAGLLIVILIPFFLAYSILVCIAGAEKQ